MKTLNQSFTYRNLDNVFQIENRKGKILECYLSDDYKKLAAKHKEIRKEIMLLSDGKKYKDEEEKQEINDKIKSLKAQQKENVKKQKEQLKYDLMNIEKIINSPNFKLHLKKIASEDTLDSDKTCYSIEKDAPSFYAMKILCRNISKSFGIKMSSRTEILMQLKCLIQNNKLPIYLIRTDVSKCFESIPHKKLNDILEDNTLLSNQSKSFIRGLVFQQFENIKEKDEIKPNYGIPRGCAISSFLSELYLRRIDDEIKANVEGIVFYARYVDDVIMAIVPPMPFEHHCIDKYLDEIIKIFERYDLKLNTGSKLLKADLTQRNSRLINFDFLGYNIAINERKESLNVTFNMSKNRETKIKDRLKKTIIKYNILSCLGITFAEKYLFSALRMLSSNTTLKNAKKNIKVGIYYNNILLDDINIITQFNNILLGNLKHLASSPCQFKTVEQRNEHDNLLKEKIIRKIDFKRGFEERKQYRFKKKELQFIKLSWR